MGKFHYKEGWYFERLDNGDVKITKEPGVSLVIDADSWVSIVASVALNSDNAEIYKQIKELHIKELHIKEK